MGYYDELLSIKEITPKQKTSGCHFVTGIIKENWDEEHQGMVKAEFLLGEEGEKVSDWMRVQSAYVGNGYGYYSLPEIGTEVIIGFLMGDDSCPFVLGCLWNMDQVLPEETANKDNTIKRLRTKAGHEIMFSEEEGKEKITISTSGNLKVVMDDEHKKIQITDNSSKNIIEIDGDNGLIIVKSEKKLELSSGSAKLTIDGSTNKIEINASQLAIKGEQTLEIGSQSLKMEGALTEIKAKGSLTLEASGIAQIKGSMLKLN